MRQRRTLLAFSRRRPEGFKTGPFQGVGGYGGKARRTLDVYKVAIETLVPVENCEIAEAAKILENTYRCVNIAMVNELKMLFDRMGIDVWEVIRAASTKPFGFSPFYPGPGLGGHCIPIDPFYLTWKARQYGMTTQFIELAGQINTGMPHYVVERVIDALNDRHKSLRGSKVLVLGLKRSTTCGSPVARADRLLKHKARKRLKIRIFTAHSTRYTCR